MENYGVGFNLLFSGDVKRLTKYDACLWWKNDKTKVVIGHESRDKTKYSLGAIAFALFHQKSEKTSYAAKIKVAPTAEKEKVDARIGVSQQISKNLNWRFRLANTGHVSFGVK
jgi:hypothetical protein